MRSMRTLLGTSLRTTTRNLAYAAVLGLGLFTIQPTLAAAEDAHGSFTLPHEVHWQKYVLAPGDYTFAVRTIGASEFLLLRGSAAGSDAMILVNEIESSTSDQGSKLFLVSKDGESFVSTMALPNYDMKLKFQVPNGAH